VPPVAAPSDAVTLTKERNMKYLIWIIAIFLLLVVQAGVLVPLHLGAGNLVLVLMILAFLAEDWDTALMIGLIGGVMLDLLSGSTFGMMTMSLLTVLILANLAFEAFLTRETWLVTYTAVGAMSWTFVLILLAFNWIFNLFHGGVAVNLRSFFFDYGVIGLIVNLVAVYPILKYLELIKLVQGQKNKPTHEQSI